MPKFIPLDGHVFGQLTAVSQAETMSTKTRWNCLCSCGNTTVVSSTHLRSGHTVSCGCAKHLDYCSLNIEGQRFGRLVAKHQVRGVGLQDGKTRWVCVCDCGNETTVGTWGLNSGRTKSCGCFQTESRLISNITHGMSKTPTYESWGSMIQRCTNPKKVKWPQYGGRGIKVCERWAAFENFFSDMGSKPDNMTLDRIDVNGDYEPDNCRWATPKEQGNNTRKNRYITCNGVTQTLAQWSEQVGISHSTISDRLAAGQSPETAMRQ